MVKVGVILKGQESGSDPMKEITVSKEDNSCSDAGLATKI